MGIGRYNNFNREINGMQILGVTITTHVTFVWHDFEKLNLYIAFMLFCIFRIGKRFIFFMCSKKKAKIKLVTIICMTSSIFWKKKKKIWFKAERTLSSQNTVWGQTPSIMLSRIKIFSGNSQFGRGAVRVQKKWEKNKYSDELCFPLWVKSSWGCSYPKLCLRRCLKHWAVMPTCISTD